MICAIDGIEFTAKAHNAKYCSGKCLQKAKSQIRKTHANYTEGFRNQNYKRNFGITIEEYDLMVLRQENRCAICNIHQSEVTRRFAVDHDHITGQIRGLLCLHCNTGLGRFKDSPELLEKAIEYLNQKMRKMGKL